MVIERVERELPFFCEQLFDLVADIERYPEFLPWWISSRIQRRESDTCYVEQVLGYGPIRMKFTSKAVLQRPVRIDVVSSEPPFRRYNLSMLFTPCTSVGCSLSIASEMDMESGLLQKIINRVLPASIDDIISAFAARAHSIYGCQHS
jgi:coenzyme Q-binding protein COQ10